MGVICTSEVGVGVAVREGVDVGVSVAAVGEDSGAEVGVDVKEGIGVGVEVVFVGEDSKVGVRMAVKDGTGVVVSVGEGVEVTVNVSEGIDVAVTTGIGVGIGKTVAIGVAVAVGADISNGIEAKLGAATRGKSQTGFSLLSSLYSCGINRSISTCVKLRLAIRQANSCQILGLISHKITFLSVPADAKI